MNLRLIVFFAFLATVSTTQARITTIHPSTNIHCGTYDAPISECGATKLLGYDMAGAKIVYEGQTVIFYNEADCTGYGASLQWSVDCFELPFRPKCVFIECY